MQPQPRIVPRLLPGHGRSSWGHVVFARSHIILLGSLRQWERIWLIDSVVLQVEQMLLSATSGMQFQYSPILKTSCIVLNRNCHTLGRIVDRLRLNQIVASDSLCPVIRFTASLVNWILFNEDRRSKDCFFFIIPL